MCDGDVIVDHCHSAENISRFKPWLCCRSVTSVAMKWQVWRCSAVTTASLVSRHCAWEMSIRSLPCQPRRRVASHSFSNAVETGYRNQKGLLFDTPSRPFADHDAF